MNNEPTPVDNNVVDNSTPVKQPIPVQTPNEPITPPVQPNPIDNTTSQSNGFNEESNGKSKTFLIVIFVILLIGLAVGAYVFFTQKKLNANETLSTSINKQVQKFNQMISNAKSVDVLKNMAATKGSGKIHLEFNSDSPELSAFSGYKFDFNGGIDTEKKLLAFDTEVVDKDNNKLNVKINGDQNYMYFDLGDIFPSTLYTPFNFDDIEISDSTDEIALPVNELNEEDITYLIELIINTATDSINEKDLVKENVKKSVYGESLNLTKISYELTKERLETIYKAVLTKMKDDQKALEILAKTDDEKTAAEWKTSIEEMLNDESGNEFTDFEKVNLNFYVNDKPELVAIEITSGEDKLSFIAYKDKYSIIVEGSEMGFDRLEIIYDDKDVDTLRAIIKADEDTFDLTMTIDDKSTSEVAKANITINAKAISGEEENNFTILFNYELSDTYDFDAPSTTDAKNFNYLTEAEKNTLMTNILADPIIGPLFESLILTNNPQIPLN